MYIYNFLFKITFMRNKLKFIVNRFNKDKFKGGLRDFFEYLDLGIENATDGDYGANIIRSVPGKNILGQWHYHELNFQMVYILEGWVKFEYQNEGVFILNKGDSVLQPPKILHREIEHSEDLMLIEVTSPAKFKSVNI